MTSRISPLLALVASPAWLAAQTTSPAFAPINDTKGLPRVLIIGDSISIGYTLPVRKLLEGRANIHRIPENAAHTGNGVAKIDSWLGAAKWDLIHFNFGLHDFKRMDDGNRQIAIEDYEKNLGAIVARLKETDATLVFATTTPVPEGKVSPPRVPADVALYNDAARRVMHRNHVTVLDLHAFALPRLAAIQRPVNVHFTDAGSDALAEEVAATISRVLGLKRPKKE